jgi:N-acetylmuramoyl-L-alanine amidase
MVSRRNAVLLGICAVVLVCAASSLAVPMVTARDALVVVQPGDTLSDIAARYGTTVAAIARLNGIANPDMIRAGQRIRIKVSATVSRGSVDVRRHVVRVGETLSSIATDFATTSAAIATENRLADPSYVRAGQVLLIPRPTRSKTATLYGHSGAPPRIVRHVVMPGETLTGIAARYVTTVAAIAGLNGLADPSYIQAGRVLRIPAGRGGAAEKYLPSSLVAVMAKREHVRRIIVAEARRARVSPTLALALAWQESGWRQEVVSSAGARGVMQVLPTTADWIGNTMLGRRPDLTSTRDNVRAGVVLLRHYLDRYGGDVRRALAAYYQGQRSADRYGVLPVSQLYVGSILGLQRMLR